MSRHDKIEWMLGIVVCALVVIMAVAFGPDHPTVSKFNDGFATSKQDDCEQGFQPACDWLERTAR
jgi:hypothetical protein